MHLNALFLLFLHVCAITSAPNENLICDDFYDYACSDWMRSRVKPASEPFWNVYSETAEGITNQLQAILERDDYASIQTERTLYKACVRSEDHLEEFARLLNQLGGIQFSARANPRYDYLTHIIEVTKLLNIHPMLNFHVKRNSLHIERGDFAYPRLFLLHPESYAEELQTYASWIEKTLAIIIVNSGNNKTSSLVNILRDTKQIAQEIVEFEIELARLPRGKTVKVLENQLARRLALTFLYDNSRTERRSQEIHIDETYFDALLRLCERTPWYHISNYILWSAIKDLARDVSVEFRRLSFEVDKQLIGVSSDVERARECVEQTILYAGHRKLQASFENVTRQNHDLIKTSVRRMAHDIQNEMMAWIQNASRLSRKTKKAMIKKIAHVRFDVLGPEVVPDDVAHLRLSGNHLENLITLKAHNFQREIGQLSKRTDAVDPIRWPSYVFDVNAFYNLAENAIILPLGILQPPFFDLRRASALNYGALGSLIGHELAHVLDNLKTLELPAGDVGWLEERAECLGASFNVTTSQSRSEDVADFTGVRLSYLAMQSKQSNEVNAESNSELFFLHYAKMWCELTGGETKAILDGDEHAPAARRVRSTLGHFKGFLQTFHCAPKHDHDDICGDVW